MKNYMMTDDYFENIRSTENHLDDMNKQSDDLNQAASTTVAFSPEAALITGAIDLTKEAIRCFIDYAKCKEHEKTERKRIAATLKAVIYQIEAQKEVCLEALNLHYKERKELYNIAIESQRQALKTGDKEMLMLSYNLILNVYNSPEANNMPSLMIDNVGEIINRLE